MNDLEERLSPERRVILNEVSERLIKAIKELKPLSEVYKEAFVLKGVALCLIIEQKVIPEIGEETFSNYCREMVKKLKTSESNYNSLTRILQFIFGSKGYAYPYGLIKSGFKIPHFSRCLYGAILPEILTHEKCRVRFKLYELCEYSQEEIAYWEDYYERNKHKGRTVHSGLQYLNISKNSLSQKETESINSRIDEFLEPYYQKRKVPPNQEIRDYLKEDNQRFKFTDLFLKASIDTIIIQKVNDLRDYLFSTQLDFLDSNQDRWKVYVKKAQALNLRIVDFTSIKSSQLKVELKAVAQEMFKDARKIPRFILGLNYMNWFEERFRINSLSEIKKNHLLVFFNYLQTEKKLKIGTVAEYKSIFKRILDVHAKINGQIDSYLNPAEAITFYNVTRRGEKTEVIPKEVILEIEKYLPELPLQYRLFYELLMQTGWRLQDIANLSPKAFRDVPEFPDLIEVTTRISKTGRARKESGLKEYLSCFIDRELYERINDFIHDTNQEREFYNIKTCFYGLSRGYPEAVTCSNLSEVINRLIREHNITYNGELWRFTTRQTRKTVAVGMVKEGSPISCVQKQLGHLDLRTTESYYTEVDQMTLASKNKELYEATVESDMNETTEASQIFYDFFLETPVILPLGFCDQSDQDSLCEKFLKTGCEDCPNFCINADSLDKLLSLKESVESRIKELVQSFKDNNLSSQDYNNLPEYQALIKQRSLLESALEALENEQE